jgi:hypothetical protein
MKKIKNRKSAGFTLLEYCAGAAVVLSVVYVAFSTMGGNLSVLMESVGTWSSNKSQEIKVLK